MFLTNNTNNISQKKKNTKLTINKTITFIIQKIQNNKLKLNNVLTTNIILTIHQQLFTKTKTKTLTIHNFTYTFLKLISSTNNTLIIQINNNNIIINFNHNLKLPLTPIINKYTNITHFINNKNTISKLKTFTNTKHTHKITTFTNNIQQLTLNILNNSPHIPFFTPFFNKLTTTTQKQLNLLPKLLKQFLSNPTINKHTNNNKTLTLTL